MKKTMTILLAALMMLGFASCLDRNRMDYNNGYYSNGYPIPAENANQF